jgi:hypothetical protein
VLKFTAVHFDYSARIAKQNLSGSFDDVGLSRAGWSQQQQVSDWTARRAQVGAMHLIKVHNGANCVSLAYDLLP